jgi:hypothetical protein
MFPNSPPQDVCTVKDDIIQSLAQKLEAMTAEATRLERALAEEEELSERNVADLEKRLHEAMLANKRNVDDDSGDMSPNFSPHPLRSATPFDQSRAAGSNAAGAPYCNGAEGDKDSLLTHLGLAARTQSCDTDVYSHARGASLAPQVGMVAPVIADVIDQLHKCRRPQKPIEGSVIITHDGDFLQLNDVELQRQSLRRRMTKITKASEVIECASKALLSVLALEDVSHGGGSNQPRRPVLATVAVPIATSAAVTANRRGSMIGVQTGRSLVAGTGGEEPLPIDLFLENQQRTDFISHATAAMTMLPSNVCQDFIAEIMRQVSCVGAGLAVASEAIAILSAGNDTSSLWLQAADSLQRVCRVQRVHLYEIHWDSRSLVPIIDGKAQERDDLGISRRIPINHGYAGKCIHMGPTIVNFPASLGQDFQPSDRGEGAVAYTMLALPIGLPGQPPVMVATLINKLVPLGAPQQSQLDALQKGKADSSSFGTLPKQHPPPANADKPPFGEGDVAVGTAVGHFIAQKAMRTRLACGTARLQKSMMARACAMGGAGVGGESVLSCTRSQELCAAMLSDMRAAANWTCIDMMLVFPGPPVLLSAATGIESCITNVAGDKHATNLWGRSSLMIHVVRDHVATSSSATPAAQQSVSFYSGAPTKVMTKAVSEESLSQLMAQLATQWLPQNFRKSATFETKSLLQMQSHLLNQIVCITVGERVVPTEVGTDYAVIQNLDHFETGCVNKGETKTVPLNNVEEIIRYACSDTARGVAQCSVEGRALISNVEVPGSWKLRYADKSHDPNAHIYARMESSSSAIAASARPFHSGASDGHQCMFVPVAGVGGTTVAVLRAEKCVQMQSREMNGTNGQHFSKDELEALDCLGRHCGSILQVACNIPHVFK